MPASQIFGQSFFTDPNQPGSFVRQTNNFGIDILGESMALQYLGHQILAEASQGHHFNNTHTFPEVLGNVVPTQSFGPAHGYSHMFGQSSIYSSGIPANMHWIYEENYGMGPASDLNGRVPHEVVTTPPQRVVADSPNGPTVVQVAPQQQIRPIDNLFENPNFIRSLLQQDENGNVSLRDGQDNSFWTVGMNKDDLANAAYRYYSVPELQEYFRRTQGRELSSDQIREELKGQADQFLQRNANNSNDWGWDRDGATADDLVVAAQKAENRNMEFTDPKFLQFMRDHFRAYSDNGGLFNSGDYINKDELKNVVDAWNNSRYAQAHGRIIYNDHILRTQLREIAGASNDEWGRESQIHMNDLDQLLRGTSSEQRFYDVPRT